MTVELATVIQDLEQDDLMADLSAAMKRGLNILESGRDDAMLRYSAPDGFVCRKLKRYVAKLEIYRISNAWYEQNLKRID